MTYGDVQAEERQMSLPSYAQIRQLLSLRPGAVEIAGAIV